MLQKISKKIFLYFFIIILFLNFNFVRGKDKTEKIVENKNVEKVAVENFTKKTVKIEKGKLEEKDKKEDSKKSEKKILKEKTVEEIDYSETKIRINEILPNPEGSDSGKEFVEIYNEDEIDLTNWYVYYESISGSKKEYKNLKSTKYFKINFSSLHNTGGTIILYDKNSTIVSKFTYTSSSSGQSWNYDENNWYLAEPTPDKENIENPTTKDYPKIIINEALPNPKGTDSGNEFIELYNPNSKTVNLDGWILKDESTSKTVLQDLEIKSEEYLVLYQGKDFSFTLNNDSDTVYLQTPNPNIKTIFSYENSIEGLSFNFDRKENYLVEPTPGEKNLENPATKNYPEIIINEIFPNAMGSDDNQEFIEFYNPNDELVELKNWKLEYVAKNKSSDSETRREFIFSDEKIGGNNFLILNNKDNNPIFDLRNNSNDGDFVTLTLSSPNPNIKFTISYEKTIEGQSYNYDIKNWYWAKTTPNTENKENSLTKNYPNLILSEILPNPIGNESTDEFIEIYNPNDFEVSLESWFLKDSSMSGIYIFNENQKISAKSYFTIYRTNFDFALNNSGGEKIYLVSPNQKIQSKTEYQSAKENLSYNFDLENQSWRWSKFLTPNEKNIFNNLPKIKKFSIDEKIYENVYANFGVEAEDIDNDELKITWDFGDGHKSYKPETRHKYLEAGTYQVSLKIYDGSEEIIKNFEVEVNKYPKYDLEIIKIVPNPKGLDSLNEYIVIKNKSGEKINLEGWSITTGSNKDKIYNHPIRESLKIKSKEEKVVTRKYSAFSLPNKKGYIELRQPDGKIVSKVSYKKKQDSK